jgi:hypothetical protein
MRVYVYAEPHARAGQVAVDVDDEAYDAGETHDVELYHEGTLEEIIAEARRHAALRPRDRGQRDLHRCGRNVLEHFAVEEDA